MVSGKRLSSPWFKGAKGMGLESQLFRLDSFVARVALNCNLGLSNELIKVELPP